MICADIVSIQGKHYSVIVDRFSSWIDVTRVTKGAETIYQQLNQWYSNFGIPRSFASDGGPEYTSTRMKDLHRRMGTIQRISSVAHPHANQRAEGAVKAVRRMLTDCMGPEGNLTGDKYTQAIMEHRNTPIRELKKSPAQLMLGRRLRNMLPLAPSMLT